MRLLPAFVSLCIAAGPAPGQATELRQEAWPQGSAPAAASLRGDAQGERRDGPYARHHPGGGLAAEGAYADGELSGPWTTYWPDGTVQMRGEFLEGRRFGKWELFHPSGALAGTGRYRLGLRDRKWVYLDEAGGKLERDSGFYRSDGAHYADRGRKFLVETRDERWHGRLVSWWDGGGALLAGHYREGLADGRFELWLADGSLEPEFVTGTYAAGARLDGETAELIAAEVPDPFELPEERGEAAPPAPDPVRLPRLARMPGVDTQQRAAFEQRIARYLEDPDERERRLAGELLLQYGRDALPEILNRLAELDLDDASDHGRAEELARLLRRVCRGRGFALTGEPEGDRRAVARWFTWFQLARDQEPHWEALRAGDAAPELLTLELVEGFLRGPAVDQAAAPAGAGSSGEAPASADGAIEPKLSLLFRRRRFETRPREIREPIEGGLAWLARHRAPDGGWRAEDFGESCERAKLAVCDGPGEPHNDVGVSALALLAFLGDGNTVVDGDHAAVVTDGLHWLLARQDPATGRFGGDEAHAAMYQHALATLVLCETASFTDSPAVRGPARRALEVLLAAQNPGAGWRYHFEPDGESDTSVTAWVVQALHAGRESGLVAEAELEPAFAGARTWFDSVTDTGTGRVGYSDRGGPSSRIRGVNDHYPVDGVEAMTAAATFARILMGAEEDVLAPQADLLLRSLPRAASSEGRTDFYYWLHGTEAMAQLGGGYWRAWRAALLRVLRGSQREGGRGTCVEGSWDPEGPWGFSGGRVYSTAVGVLCLEGEFRNPLWLR